MASFSHYSLQKAVFEKLTGNAPLMALITSVYDRPPAGASFPYITIGDADIADLSSLGALGTEQRVELHIWSREGGRAQAATIMDAVYGLLHNGSLTIIGQQLISIRFLSSEIMLENDGWTYHGRMQLRVLLYVV